ncbi:hypothetical protein OAU07_06220 [Alphaproteobacteria bacterium]|nr:hypothetical protein [Alphaproteobacteria bacterium]
MSFQAIIVENQVTGYTYEVVEDGVVSIYTFDANYELIGTSIEDDAAGTTFSNLIEEVDGGGTVESGSQIEGDYSREFEYNFDADGAFTGGTETVNGSTTTYGADWEILSVSISIDAAEALSPEDKDKLPPAVIAALAAEDDSVYQILSGSDDYTLQTLYKDVDGQGVIIGYVETFSFDGDETGSASTYSDSEWNFIGNRWSDTYASGYHFITPGDDGAYTEVGANESDDYNTSYEYNFDSEGALIDGAQTINGRTTTYGADWEITEESVSVEGLVALTEEELVSIPDKLKGAIDANDDTFKDTYATESYSDGSYTEITYLDEGGAVLGYGSFWSDDWGSSVSYHDSNWNWLGGGWEDADGSNSGFNSNYEISLDDLNTADDYASNLESFAGVEFVDGDSDAWPGDDADAEALLADLLAADPVSDLTEGAGTVTHTDELGNTLTLTVTADGVTGMTIADSGDTTIASSDTSGAPLSMDGLYDATLNNILDAVSDTGLLEIIAGTEFSSTPTKLIVETGSNSFDGETQSFTYVYTENWELVAGEETRGATTFEYGPHWELKASATNIDTESGDFELADLTDLPDAFVSKIFPDGSLDADGVWVDDNDDGNADVPVYTQTKNWDWGGTETTYFDADGGVLGYVNYDSWSDDYQWILLLRLQAPVMAPVMTMAMEMRVTPHLQITTSAIRMLSGTG